MGCCGPHKGGAGRIHGASLRVRTCYCGPNICLKRPRICLKRQASNGDCPLNQYSDTTAGVGFAGDGIMKTVVGLAALLGAFLVPSTPALSATYHIDAFAEGGIPGSGVFVISSVCSAFCDGPLGYRTPLYEFLPGDVVDFGSVTIQSYIYCDGRNFACGIYTPKVQVAYDSSPGVGGGSGLGGFCFTNGQSGPNPSCFPSLQAILATLPPLTFDLFYTLPDGATGIQVEWTGPFFYTPPSPVPVPAALPLFAAGLGIVAFLARRKKTAAARPA